MKRLILLTALLIVTASTTGCRCFDWMYRGSSYPAAAPVVMGDPCNPCSTPVAPGAARRSVPAIFPPPSSSKHAGPFPSAREPSCRADARS